LNHIDAFFIEVHREKWWDNLVGSNEKWRENLAGSNDKWWENLAGRGDNWREKWRLTEFFRVSKDALH
jgi:hypothetical protein